MVCVCVCVYVCVSSTCVRVLGTPDGPEVAADITTSKADIMIQTHPLPYSHKMIYTLQIAQIQNLHICSHVTQLRPFHGRRPSGPFAPPLHRSSASLPPAASPPSPPQDSRRSESNRAALRALPLSPSRTSQPRLPRADGGQPQRLRGCGAVRGRQSKGGLRGWGWRGTLSCCCRRGGTASR